MVLALSRFQRALITRNNLTSKPFTYLLESQKTIASNVMLISLSQILNAIKFWDLYHFFMQGSIKDILFQLFHLFCVW